MKAHPEMTPQLILDKMRTPTDSPLMRDGQVVAPAEDAHAKEALITIAQNPDNVRVLCVGCGGQVAILASGCCVCGGFVCPDCMKVEPEGVCAHDDPTPTLDDVYAVDDDDGYDVTFSVPTPETLTVKQALRLLRSYIQRVSDAELLGPSRVNSGMSKAAVVKILVKAVADLHVPLDEPVSYGRPTRVLLARNVLREVGLLAD